MEPGQATFPVPDDRIAAVRRFNRFHTKLVGALNDRMLNSQYSLSQVRILYEIANAPRDAPLAAAALAGDLGMDAGYLSRLLSGMERDGLILREPSPENGKRLTLGLTEQGRDLFNDLNATSAQEVAELLEGLPDHEQAQLVGAMSRVRRLLGDGPADRTFILRDPEPGDLGYITHQQSRLYTREYGWDWTFEALVSEIVGKFVQEFVPGRERCWIAECEGDIVGSVFLVRQDDETAKLRLLYVDAAARGLGLGRRLVQECIRFAQAKGYKRMVLWTNDVLVSARRIYEGTGFTLLEEEPHHSFGKDLVGQIWGRDL